MTISRIARFVSLILATTVLLPALSNVQAAAPQKPSAKPPTTTDRAKTAFDRGNTAWNRGEASAAITAFTQAIALQPTYTQAYINRGILYYLTGQFDKAIADYYKGHPQVAVKPAPRAAAPKPATPRPTPRPALGSVCLNDGEEHFIQNNSGGTVLILEDGSRWLVSPADRSTSSIWLATDDITITDDGDPGYPCKLINTDDHEGVAARRLGG